MNSLAWAEEFCRIKDVNAFHPSGTPYTRIEVKCTDEELQATLLERYDDYRVGVTSIFLKEIKKQIIADIRAAGYQKIKDGLYQKN